MSDANSTETAKITQHKQRSRAGCWNCRSKTVKKRCDQDRPECGRCRRLDLVCDYTPRPTLAERRRIEKVAKLAHSATEDCEAKSSSPGSSISSRSPSLPCVALAMPTHSASSLDLSFADHEAIRHFRFVFPRSHHVKNTDYSLIALMFQLATEEPMVMHMVLAISLQELNARRVFPDQREVRQSVQHYSSAIRLVASAISPSIGESDLDAMCTALWMMLLYEQQFGDSRYTAYISHLNGISSLLQHQFNRVLKFDGSEVGRGEESVALIRRSKARDPTILSAYSARILVWIALMDSAAASAGIGGQVNATILNNLLGSNNNISPAPTDPVNAFACLRRYSAPLYRLAWAPDYPQDELLDDLENGDAYVLLTECVQLRYMTAQLATLLEYNPTLAAVKTLDVQNAILEVRSTFAELIDMAGGLSVETDNTSRLVANIRIIVPMYYAVVLDFLRLTSFDEPLGGQQRHALKEIMNLGFQNRLQGDDESMIKMAWPLFVAAMETDDMLHQEWVLEQFEILSKFGRNFRRAHMFLLENIPLQQSTGKRIDIRAEMSKTALFVLG